MPRSLRSNSTLSTVAYASGDAGFNLYWVTWEMFLLVFLTDVYVLPLSWLAPLLLMTRLADALTSLGIGYLADRVQSPIGRYRPFVVLFTIPVAVLSIIFYTAPSRLPLVARLLVIKPSLSPVYACMVAILFSMAYAAANVPYIALLAATSQSIEQKARTASLRSLFAMTASFSVQFYTLRLISRLGGGSVATGWSRTASVYALIATLMLLLCGFFTNEAPIAVSPAPLRMDDIAILLRRPRWRNLTVAMLLVLGAHSARAAITVYYARYVWRQEPRTGLFLGAAPLASFFSSVLLAIVAKRFRPASLAFCCASVSSVVCLALLTVAHSKGFAPITVQAMYGLSAGALTPLLFALFADLQNRSTSLCAPSMNGLLAAFMLITLKVGSLAGGLIIAFALDHSGYRPNSPQSTETQQIILLLATVLPSALFAAVATVLYRVR